MDPISDECRYVGKTKRPEQRFKEHLKANGKTHRDYWIRSIRPELPVMIELEKVSDDGWEIAERKWIRLFKSLGEKLTNGTDGGEGGRGLSHSEETKALLSNAMKGKLKSAETKAKMRMSCSMKRPEVAAKNADSKRGKPRSEETKEKLRIASTGKKQSDETIKKRISKINKEDWASKISKSHKRTWAELPPEVQEEKIKRLHKSLAESRAKKIKEKQC